MLKSTKTRWFSRWLDGRLDPVNGGQWCSVGGLENKSGKPMDLTKNWHSDSSKKCQLTLCQDMVEKGDDVPVDDDAVRTSVSQT
jgi:hypothetical protein